MTTLSPEITPSDAGRLADFCRQHQIRRLSLFGSALRGELRPGSDVDLLVEFEQGHTPGFFDLVTMERELTEILGRKADLRTAAELSRHFRDDVVSHARTLYASD